MTGPRRVLIDWDYRAHGIWRVLTKEEKEAPAPRGGRWAGGAPFPPDSRPRPWSDRLSAGLLDDLQAWNDSYVSGEDPGENGDVNVRARQEQGRELAIRVQDELGTDGWEVLYRLGDRMFRVHPPSSWPARSWQQELLGYAPREGKDSEGEGPDSAGGS